jgi:hypothetical protein
MSPLLQPLHLLLMMFAGWVNRHQLDAIDYLQEEIACVLKERLGGRRIRLTDVECRRLAQRVYALGRKVLNELERLVTPDTFAIRPGTGGIKMELQVRHDVAVRVVPTATEGTTPITG